MNTPKPGERYATPRNGIVRVVATDDDPRVKVLCVTDADPDTELWLERADLRLRV